MTPEFCVLLPTIACISCGVEQPDAYEFVRALFVEGERVYLDSHEPCWRCGGRRWYVARIAPASIVAAMPSAPSLRGACQLDRSRLN